MLCLNIGCHDMQIEGFINIDLDENMKPDLVANVKDLKKHFGNNSVDFIYCGHLLEHLSILDGKNLVKDIYDILKPYGSIMAVVPDHTKCDNITIEEKESVIIADGQHKVLMDIHRLKSYFKNANFLTIIEAQPYDLGGHCFFPNVKWQTAIIALKHEKISQLKK